MANSKEQTLRAVLGSDTQDASVHSQAILEILRTASDQEEKAELLSIALVERDSVKKEPIFLSNKGISTEEWDTLHETYARLLTEYMRTAFFKARDAKGFAADMLKLLDIYDDDKVKAFLLGALIFRSPFVPYRQLPGEPVKMPQHDFDHILAANQSEADLISYVSRLPFPTVVEHASLLLQVIDAVQKKEVRVALLALGLLRHRNEVASALIDKNHQK